jgi:hypothetical protein
MKDHISIALMALSLWSIFPTATQRASNTLSATSNLDNKMGDFSLDDKSLLDGVQILSKTNKRISIGFEKILTPKVADAEVPYPKVTVRLKNATTREALNALCAADPRFTWSLDGLTVNIFPRITVTDSKYLLKRKLPKFRLTAITDIDHGLFAIPEQLPGPVEQIAHSQIGGDDSYPTEPWSASFEDITVRQAVNRLAEHMGNSSSWIFRSRDTEKRNYQPRKWL